MRKCTHLLVQQLAFILRVFQNLKLQALMILVALVCHFSVQAQPSNDLPCNAISIGPGFFTGNTYGANHDSYCGGSSSIWYKITGTGTTVNVNTCNGNTNYDSYLSAFDGNFNLLACNDDACWGLSSNISFYAAAGQVYYIQVGGFGGQQGSFGLSVSGNGPAPPQSNNHTPASQPTAATSSTNFCGTSNVTLSVTSGNLNDANEWKWYQGNCGGSYIGSGTSINVNVSATTTFYVRGEGGCASAGVCGEVTVEVRPLPNVSITTQGPSAVCAGSTVTLNASGGVNYVWSTGETTSSISVSQGGSYSVTATGANGCTATANKVVNVVSYPSVSITNVSACSNGTDGTATATVSGSGGGAAIYAATGAQGGALLLSLDANTGATTIIGNTGLGGIPAIAASPDGKIYATSNQYPWRLYELNPTNGSATLIGYLNSCSVIAAMSYDNSGILYAMDFCGYLYTINTSTGSANLLATPNQIGFAGMQFDPITGILYATDKNNLFTIDKTTGLHTYVGSLNSNRVSDLVFDAAGNLYGVNGGGYGSNEFFAINKQTAATSSIGYTTNSNVGGMTRGGNAYTYVWSNGQTTATATGLSAGTHSVTVTNSTDCASTVNVVINSCNSAPVAVCQAVTVSANANCQGNAAATAFDGGSTDADAGDVLTYSVSPAGPYVLGVTNVTLTVTDSKGASSSCNTTVTVTDNINPTIICPANVAATTNSGCTATGVALGTPTTSDNCTVASVANDAPTAFPLGTTTVTWTVTDGSGNTATCTQTVTVTDNIEPSITCPANVAATTNTGCIATGVNLGNPATSDNCSVASVTNNAPAAFPLGTTTVIWTATDVSGNTATCTQTVTVTDKEKPTITCPGNITANPTSLSGAVVNYSEPTYSDNCPGSTVSRSGPASGSTFPIGTTNVTYTVTDAAGNTETCTFTITVRNPICDNYPNNKKVYVCHNGKTICISVNALQTHLDNGAKLGDCSWYQMSSTTSTNHQEAAVVQPEPLVKALTIKAFPNPTNTYFTLTMKSLTNENVQVKVYDMVGREVFIASGAANETYQFGEKFSKGNYLVRVLQGDKQATVTLTKQ